MCVYVNIMHICAHTYIFIHKIMFVKMGPSSATRFSQLIYFGHFLWSWHWGLIVLLFLNSHIHSHCTDRCTITSLTSFQLIGILVTSHFYNHKHCYINLSYDMYFLSTCASMYIKMATSRGIWIQNLKLLTYFLQRGCTNLPIQLEYKMSHFLIYVNIK